MLIQGDYNSAKARHLQIRFEKCEQKREDEAGTGVKCKTDDEVKEWLKRKFILTYANSIRFRLELFNSAKIVKESRTTWIPINTQYREEKVFMSQVTYAELQDRLWQWGAVTKEDHEDLFKIEQTNSRPYEFKDNVHVSVSYELYLNLTVLDR